MQCVILAGGLGTRIRSSAPRLPKSLIPVAGRPFVEYQIALLRREGVEEVLLCVGHRGGMIERRIGGGERLGIAVSYSYDGPRLLGTGGALRRAISLLRPSFFLLYGDSYADIPLSPLLRRFRSSGCPALMAVYRNRGRYDRSNAVFRRGRVVLYEKGGEAAGREYIDYGVSVLSRGVVGEIPAGKVYSMADLYRRLAAEGRLAGYEVGRRFYEIGSPAGLSDFRRLIEKR